MECIIIGPSNYNNIQKFGKIDNIDSYINEAAQYFASNFDTLIIVPDYGLSLLIAIKYKELISSGKVIGYYPDKTSGGKNINKYFKHCDQVIGINGGWSYLNTKFTSVSDNIFCLGFSAGVFIELCSIKYHQNYLNKNTRVFIDKRCINTELNPEISSDIKNIIYIDSFKDINLNL